MRTRTFNRVGLIALVAALGLLLVGCDVSLTDAIVAPTGGELTITTWGDNDGTKITFTGDQGKSATLEDDSNSGYSDLDDIDWIYNLPDGNTEYVVVEYDRDGKPTSAIVHLWESKKPPQLDQ